MSKAKQHALLEDTFRDISSELGFPNDFHLVFRGYNKRLNGTYRPSKHLITLYVFEDPQGRKYKDANSVLLVFLHELIHHYQWAHDSSFVRKRGVMHNAKFHALLREAVENAKRLGYITNTPTKDAPEVYTLLDAVSEDLDILGFTSFADFRIV